jgi:pyruvate/2-oxoglutarate dehydrogenase complex dihydrolipoamide dehydrogenase (E3) component
MILLKLAMMTLRFKKAVIATGARAARLPIEGIEEAGYLTNETVFSLTERPQRLALIGGGPIDCELAQAFRRLGCEVVLFHRSDLTSLIKRMLTPQKLSKTCLSGKVFA